MVDQALFDLTGRVVVITGAGGLLGQEHCLAVGRAGGIPVLLDVSADKLKEATGRLTLEDIHHISLEIDVTSENEIKGAVADVLHRCGSIWGLVNNVATNTPIDAAKTSPNRLEKFPVSQWDQDIRVGLTSAFLCSRLFGESMAQSGAGSIVNIASDLAVISPDQRMYATGVIDSSDAPVKPVSYSVVKSALIGLTKYLATYWSPIPVRCNALLPGSVLGTQGPDLVRELIFRIPLGRLARPAEYHGALVFLLSDASAYMTGANLVMDGGRTTW